MLLSAWAGLAHAAVPGNARPGVGTSAGFNFSYQSEGSRGAAPTQVFDDGRRTYLQFNALDRVPEIWTDEAGNRIGAHRIAFHLESPYVIVDQVLARIRLVVEGEDTVLVNQAWHAPRLSARSAAKVAPPRIWTDTTPFGPGDPPGPVANAREARPSREVRKRPIPPAQPARSAVPAFAVSDEAADIADLEGPAAVASIDPEQAEQSLQQRPILLSQQFEATRLEQMRSEALGMIERARREGNAQLEAELRRIFRDLAQSVAAPLNAPVRAERGEPRKPRPDPVPQRGPLLALADTRLRPDVTPREEVDASDQRPAPPLPAATGGMNGLPGESAEGAPAAARPARVAAAGPAAEILTFEVRDNQRLSQALSHFLETQGWRLEWESQSDFVVRRGYVVRAPTLKQILLEALGEYRLSAVLYSGNLVVAVSGGQR
jgi:hypothetical protein